MTIKSSLQKSIATVKAYLTRNCLNPFKNLREICVFGTNKIGSKCIICFWDHKRHTLARNDVIWRTDRKNRCRGLIENKMNNAPPPEKLAESVCTRPPMRVSGGSENPLSDSDKTSSPMPNLMAIGMGDWRQWGSNFTIFHWIAFIYAVVLKTAGTTVPVCDLHL